MRRLPKAILAIFLLALASCSNNSDNAHTTATTVVPPPPKQVLRAETRPSAKATARADNPDPHFNPENPLLVFNLAKNTVRENEEVVIDFQLANAKLKGDGGEYRVRYFVDDGEMVWIDKWEQVVLTGWTPGNHTIRLELVGPDGWPYRNGNQNVMTRELTVIK